jgi:hypothetical protein
MSKSIDTILKELIESQTKQTVALDAKLTAMAGDNNTYFDRMKKMEEGLTEAMKKVIEMDASMKECNMQMGKQIENMEAKYAGLYQVPDKNPDNDDEGKRLEMKTEGNPVDASPDKVGGFKETGGRFQGPNEAKAEYEQSSEDTGRKPEQEAKMAEDAPAPAPAEGGNVLDGVNKTKVTGQPDDMEDDEDEVMKRKRLRIGQKVKAEESNEEPKAKEVKEVKAEQASTAPVASQESSINATAKALNDKIEAVLEKLASVSNSKSETSAEVEVTKVALAKETKAKEEAVAQMKALSDKFDSLMAKVSTIEKSASTVEQKAAQIVARTGVEAVEVSIDHKAKDSEQTDEEAFKQFEALKGTEQRKFYLANKTIIERHASALLRAKRS